ncbi:DegV family protein [Butyrivibrio sp. VCB2006]|uniref:DegV family protein n=1 Tax=Butyrivibrio sp. VCB2006 TaxID=1280679 RepID=UPI000405DDD3|nr:DegV family protein [Butyrivibrio sp. VCB2006]
MIRKLLKNVLERLKDPSRTLRERVFIALTLLTDFGAFLALISNIIVGENLVEIVTLIITIIVVPIITIVSVKRNKVQSAVRFIVISLVGIILPILFYFGGGLTGGGYLWIIFTYLYTGLVLSGKWRPIMLVVLTIESIIFYFDNYLHSERVVEHERQIFFIDSLVSVIMVGTICCIMVWFVEWMFIEENKRAKEETRKFEELNKSQNRFFSSMSHEIRTPINSILGLNEIILRQEDASEEIKKDAGNIQGAGKMLLALVNDILDLSKIEAGKMDIVPVNYSVSSFISEIVNMLRLRAEQKGLELKVEIDPTLPQELFGDEVRIKQILVNLLNNAVKYTNEGTVTLHIEKEDIKDENVRIIYSVSDTGMGIKEDSIPYLFDAFQRIDEERNTKIEGTGLGLSIVKQLVELMNGEIAVNSVYSQGSTFTVSLWQKVSNPAPVGEINITSYGSVRDNKRYEASFSAPEARILIVDDNEMNLEVERKLLDGTSITVDTVTSGAEALARTIAVRYDIIFMDHLMPVMNGIECLQAIRKQSGGLNNHVPVIVLTANAGSENRVLYNSSGFDGYLLKPVSGTQVEEMILTHLPESKVALNRAAVQSKSKLNTAKGYNKKIPLIITTSSMCDLPNRTLKEYQIDTIPFKVHADGKEYYDGLEADADEIIRYMQNGMDFTSEPPTVAEFEQFFAKELKKAHQLIYITVAPGISKEFERARQASKAYGNVFIFNSGYNSSSTGMLVLLAYSMANQGMSPGHILNALTEVKKDVRCSFVASDPSVLYKRGFIGKRLCELMLSVGLRPFVVVKNDTFKVERVQIGNRNKSYDKYVDFAIPRKTDHDLEVVMVTYSDVAEDALERIEKRIRANAPFKNIIFQKASAALSVSCGPGAFGIMYLEKGIHPYNLEKYLVFPEDPVVEVVKNAVDTQKVVNELSNAGAETDNDRQVSAPSDKWYDNIPGIDSKVAIQNSGSEESFKSVLKIFYDSIDNREQEISGFYNSEDFENYTIKVHALKSSARLIGASALSKAAEALEMAGKEGNIDYIRQHHQETIEELRSYKEPLSAIFAAEEKKEEPKAEENDKKEKKAPSVNYNEFLIKSMYDAIREGISQNNNGYLQGLFKEMEDYDLGDHKDRFARLKALFETSDLEGMKAILEEVQ